MRLNASTLSELSPEVARPMYDRSGLRVGIVHIGVGGFHRSHQAMYLDRLMNAGLAHDWAICGVGLLPGDARMRDVMREQDRLYSLMLKDAGGERHARVIGSLLEYLFAPDDPADCARVLVRLLADRTRWPAMREAARKHVAAHHDWARNALRYHAIYHSLLGQTGDTSLPAAA